MMGLTKSYFITFCLVSADVFKKILTSDSAAVLPADLHVKSAE